MQSENSDDITIEVLCLVVVVLLFLCLCVHIAHTFFVHLFKVKILREANARMKSEKYTRTHTANLLSSDMVAECVFELKCEMKESSKGRAKKSNVVEIFLMLVPRRQKKPTASLKFVGGEMGDGKMLIFERNDEKHSDACIKTYTYKCAYRTRNSSAGGGGPAYSPHVCTASSAAAVTHFM